MNTVSVPGDCCFCIYVFVINFLICTLRVLYIYRSVLEKTWSLVYTWNHLEIHWRFFQIAAFFVCLISFRHVLYLCTRSMVYNQWEVLCAFRENWNELQYSLHHMKQSSRKQRTWERMTPKPCSHSLSKPTKRKMNFFQLSKSNKQKYIQYSCMWG